MTNIHFSRGTKYIAANLLLVALVFIVIQYFMHTKSSPSGDTGLAVGGIILYLLTGAVIVFRAYYHKQRFQFLDKTPAQTALDTEGLLGAERLKNVTLKLHINEADFRALLSRGTLALSPDIFGGPIRQGDTVQVHTGDAGRSGYAPARITDIDGYNQKVAITLIR